MAFRAGASLAKADLTGANLAWNSHSLIGEILRREANNETEKLEIARLVLENTRLCWKDFLGMHNPLTGWAIRILAEYIQSDDTAPNELKSAIKQYAIKESEPK